MLAPGGSARQPPSISARKMMSIVLSYGYRDWVGIEYEGKTRSEDEGIKLTKKLLETVRDELT